MNTAAMEAPAERQRCSAGDPLDESLYGEYLRMILIGTTACSAIFWSPQVRAEPLAMAVVGSCLVALGALTSRRLEGFVRLLLLFPIAVVLASLAHAERNWTGPIVFFSPAMVLSCLIALSLRDLVIVLRRRDGGVSYQTLGLWGIAASALIYLIVVPTIGSILSQFQERPTSHVVEELTVLQVLRIRSAKLVIFAIFAYVGACIGSFLNVVAASAPRGESITSRSSACPNCHTPIRRVDNLPIFSYLMLKGRCRSCGFSIPVRYLMVELIGTAIFASLFLFELVTGAANVPRFQHYFYTGILWIILYTKWPVVGIYFYHATVFSCLLMLALMENDGFRCPRWLAITLVLALVVLPICAPVLQPVGVDAQLTVSVSNSMPSWLYRLVTCVAGGAASDGWSLCVRDGL